MNNRLSEWQRDGHPLRAGVSSFAIGGTNAHAVLEEAPEPETAPARRNWKLLLLSAKTQTALERAAENLAEFLKQHPETNLADAAYTLQVGRSVFPHRRMVVGPDVDSAAAALSSDEPGKHPTFHLEEEKTSAVFMFAGLGAQYVDMGLGLYETEPVFREEMDRCFEILQPLLDYDIKEVLYPASREYRSDIDINRFEVAQVVVFILEYALAELLMNWGVKPHAMIGYSFGEYTAACLSGVFSLEDALKLVVLRGKLIGRGPAGSMLSVPMTAEQLIPLIPGELSLAVDNGPSCIVSGPCTAVDAFEKQLKEKKYLSMRVPNSHALHSQTMEPILKEFESFFGGITLNRPQIPYISNVTGTWITVEEALDPAYWAGHLRRTVRFADGINLLKEEFNPIFIEIGPGRDLSTLLVRHRDAGSQQQAFNLVRQEQQDIPDDRYLLSRIGYLWLHGIKIDWQQFYAGERRRRIPLTTYPFERRRYWIEGNPFQTMGNTSYAAPSLSQPEEEQSSLFYLPSWRPTVLRPLSDRLPGGLPEGKDTREKVRWLMFIHESNFTSQLVKRLEKEDIEVIQVRPAVGYKQLDNVTYAVNPQNPEDYENLLTGLQSQDRLPVTIVHCWGISVNNRGGGELTVDQAEKAQLMGLYSLVHLARAIG
ncbi:MAG: type I polyketide synthase, partial [bacterium]|nr:type I polyketide synthase [bacterium]